MSKILVPDAPQVHIPSRRAEKSNGGRVVSTSPLDAAFLARIYRSMAWFGVVLTVLIALGFRDAALTASFAGGVLLAAFLLRAQEIGVRALMRPAAQMGGMDARLFMLFLLPIKFLLLIGALATLNYFGMIRPALLAAGFFAGQLVIVAKVVGWMLARAAKN